MENATSAKKIVLYVILMEYVSSLPITTSFRKTQCFKHNKLSSSNVGKTHSKIYMDYHVNVEKTLEFSSIPSNLV